MTAFRFRETRLSCGLSQAETAKVLRVTLRTVQNWESGTARVSYAAYKLLRILRGYELPGREWRGWRLVGGTLYTPEGRHIHAHEGAWWSLLVAMAREFRQIMAERRSAGSGHAASAAALPAPPLAPDRRPRRTGRPRRTARRSPGLVSSATSRTPRARIRARLGSAGDVVAPAGGGS